MGGKRDGAGRHKRDCGCDKCKTKHGDRPVDGNVARRIKAKIKAEEKWIRIVAIETELMEKTGKTAPLRTSLIYLDNRDLGNPRDTVNHLHDKPIEMNVNVSIAEIVRKVRERKELYERSR